MIYNFMNNNLLNWYPFEEDAKKLYISRIKRINLNNMLYIDNFNYKKYKLKNKYNYIIVDLEGNNVKDTIEDFIKFLKSFLKDNGKLLLLMDNKYGIRYLAGNKGDIYNRRYQSFIDDNSLSLYKIEKSLKCFDNYKFYYPFPDYKKTFVIYSDDRMPTKSEILNIPVYNYKKEYYNFDVKSFLSMAIDDEMFKYFSNSYIIEATMNKSNLLNMSYLKFQQFRNLEYDLFTYMDNDGNYYKKCSNDLSKLHLNELLKIQKEVKNNKINIGELKKIDEYTILSKKIKGKTVLELLIMDIENNKKDEFLINFQKYVDFVESCCNYEKISNCLLDEIYDIYSSKTKILKVGLLDFNLENVIYNNGKYILFDQEWYTDKQIPMDYVIYFSIKLLYESNSEISKIINDKELYDKYYITNEKKILFDKISIYYFDKIKKFKDIEKFKNIKNNNFINIVDLDKYNLDIDYDEVISQLKESYEGQLKQVLNSSSWKITKPLRKLSEIIHKIKK